MTISVVSIMRVFPAVDGYIEDTVGTGVWLTKIVRQYAVVTEACTMVHVIGSVPAIAQYVCIFFLDIAAMIILTILLPAFLATLVHAGLI